MKITLLTVGKIRESWWTEAIAEYVKRLGAYAKVSIIEVEDEKTPEHAPAALEEQIKDKEGQRLLAKLSDGCKPVGICFQGQLTERIDNKPWDIPVARIVTETGLRDCDAEEAPKTES